MAAKQLPYLQELIVMDASWTKSAVLMQSEWLRTLPKVTLPLGAPSRFWRYPPKRSEHSEYFSPHKVQSLLSTVEAVHRFCDAYAKAKDLPNHQFDDLLWLFAFLHGRVRSVYEETPGKRQRIMRKSKGLMNQF